MKLRSQETKNDSRQYTHSQPSDVYDSTKISDSKGAEWALSTQGVEWLGRCTFNGLSLLSNDKEGDDPTIPRSHDSSTLEDVVLVVPDPR